LRESRSRSDARKIVEKWPENGSSFEGCLSPVSAPSRCAVARLFEIAQLLAAVRDVCDIRVASETLE
jgi:hypothetical protein